ncbi:MAG: DUF945 domain-containing protein [Acetobacter sp.]|nr:DUF945 domain-containing protein [Acetobacter sp.]
MEQTNLLNADPERIRKAVMKRFSPLDGIGKDLQECASYDDALKKSGLGFDPLVKKLKSDDGDDVPGYKGIYNGKDCLSVVKSDYTVVSNREAFAIAEDLCSQEGFQYCTSSINKNGARCRLVLSGPDVKIADEIFVPYAILNNSFDLSRSISVQFMFMRLVCLNGLMRRTPKMQSSIFLTHFGEKDTKLKRLAQFNTSFAKTLSYLQREAEALKNVKMTKDEFRSEILPLLVSHVFQRPDDAMLTERQVVRTQSFIESVLSAYDATDTENFNNTAYKVLLTMTDLDSHLSPFVNRNNPDVYINRVLQTDTLMSMANVVANHIISTRKLHI